MANEEYLSARTISRELDIGERTVRYWMATGQLPTVRVGARSVRVPRAAVEEFVHGRELDGTAAVAPS
jgi:excisionase family DNA binding protein